MTGDTKIGLMALAFAAALNPLPTAGQDTPAPAMPENPSEEFLTQNIQRLDEFGRDPMPAGAKYKHQAAGDQVLILYVEMLLEQYPKTAYKDAALIAKLGALARRARMNPLFLQELLTATKEISHSKPKGKLASENAYYAIQAFVFGARYEDMPDERRRKGTIERYRAFIEDYPSSARAAAIHASLIRSLIADGRVDQAEKELAKLEKNHANNAATRRAKGEVYRARAVGRPFKRTLTTSEGKAIRVGEYAGKVLMIHFHSRSHRTSKSDFARLSGLYDKHHARGLEIISVELGAEQTPAEESADSEKIAWTEYREPMGFRSDIVIDNGIIKLPTFFVIDRKGILRGAGHDVELSELVERLLSTTG
ncbi:MAG: redoxin domain-containing protein [Phycisphaerales bacterium]|nr:MAG: redoxin domain-containing protein [Phycisphaerales bacterium]